MMHIIAMKKVPQLYTQMAYVQYQNTNSEIAMHYNLISPMVLNNRMIKVNLV